MKVEKKEEKIFLLLFLALPIGTYHRIWQFSFFFFFFFFSPFEIWRIWGHLFLEIITLKTPMAETPNREIFAFSKQNFESNFSEQIFFLFRAKTLLNSQSNPFYSSADEGRSSHQLS
jgi:hypothetical protein